MAKQLDELDVKWTRNTKRFYYEYKGHNSYYIPDFYIIDHDFYLETKGYWYNDKKTKNINCSKAE